VTRPCRWPDGGCGAEVEFFPTGKLKNDGKPVLQVLDAKYDPAGNILIRDGVAVVISLLVQPAEGEWRYVDHHATCPKWAAKVERERAAKAARP
jgi:hypothetical protein